MRFARFVCNFVPRKNVIKSSFSFLSTIQGNFYVKSKSNLRKQLLASNNVIIRLASSSYTENDELYEDLPVLETQQFEPFENARKILFQNTNDKIINELNKCVSIEEVLNLVRRYVNVFEDKHVTQTIFVLRDLQNIYYHYNDSSSSSASNEFVSNLYQNKEYNCLISTIDAKLSSFNPEYLSYVLLYLNKLGIPMENQLMQKVALKVRDDLLQDFALDRCSRFLRAVFSEWSIRPYYLSLNIIPIIASQIDKCTSVEDFAYLTVCLNRLHNIVTHNMLVKYKEKVTTYLKNEQLKDEDYPVILKIISFLNYPKWRDESVLLTSDCILLMKNKISGLNITELIMLYEVFFKNQEPGEILNSIQRCSAKYLQQLEETESQVQIKLKLFSSIIYFSSPTHRMQFRKEVQKYLKNSSSYYSLVLLRQIFSYIKISDERLCTRYWNLCLKMLNDDKTTENVLKLCQTYMHFNIDINGYRHYKFENTIMKFIEKAVKEDKPLFPSEISTYLSFAILYSKSDIILKKLLDKFEENCLQFIPIDCLKLSHSLLLLTANKDSCITEQQINNLKNLLNKCTENLLAVDENNFLQNKTLIKAAILRDDYDNLITESMLMKYKELDYMSSKIMESICYIFLATDSLIPEVINKCTEYVIKHPNNIVGFNAEKILYLCYHLAYYPINADQFFDVVTDIIIRDQERLSGLAFLQSALSLCYFNKLPSSFIKQIFNVEFLEKLDVELANCYSKDKYPQRVRHSIMQLNRAVCLEYPEFDVPWFHQKYIEEYEKKYVRDVEYHFPLRIKEYLSEILGTSDYLLENVLTPYGYHIDFVVNLNKKEQVVLPTSLEINKRVALLLIRQHAFTRFYTLLKGRYQLKKRHLEMLGYVVAIINFNEWVNLLYAGERLEYLSNLIWPSRSYSSVNACKR